MPLSRYARLLGPALAALALSCAPPIPANPTPAPPGPFPPQVAPYCCVGERCGVDGVALTVRGTSMPQTVSGAPTPQPGNMLLIADVTIEVTGNSAMSYAPQYFRLQPESGVVYQATAILPDETGSPGPGETVLLQVVFEVPQGSQRYNLFYAPPELAPQEVQVDLTC